MTKTYIMGIYRTTVKYQHLGHGERKQIVMTRADSVATAEAMALGKVLREKGTGAYICLLSVNTEEVEKPC